MQMAGGYTIPTEGALGLNLMDYNTLKNSGYSDGQIEELQLNPDINTEEVIRDIKGPIPPLRNRCHDPRLPLWVPDLL